MAKYTFCWYDTKDKKARSIQVQAKTKDLAIVLLAEKLEKLHEDEVAGLCVFDTELAYQWIKDNFPHCVGWNIIIEDLQRHEISF